MRDAVLAQCAMEFVHADVLRGHVRFDSLSVVNQRAWFALHYPSEPAAGTREGSDRVVQQQKRGRRNDAPISDVSSPVIAFCTELKEAATA